MRVDFLDTSVSRRNGVGVVEVYRKPTHTDRYLDLSSHREIRHKISTASTHLFWACNLPGSYEEKTREKNNVWDALKANGYPSSIDHFTIVYSVTWPLCGSEAGSDLALIQTSLLLLCKCT